MILRDLLEFFNISVVLPQYLYLESFNEVFKKAELVKDNGNYKLVANTRRNVVHTLIIDESDEFPVRLISRLPNGSLNGMKFGQNKGETRVIDSY